MVVRELAKGELNLRAISLVFTTLLSLVPLIAVAFSVLKVFGVHNQIEPFLLSVLEPLGSKGAEITSNIIGFVQIGRKINTHVKQLLKQLGEQQSSALALLNLRELSEGKDIYV